MATNPEVTNILQCATSATMRPCSVRLDELKLHWERYCHREDDELKPESLELFLDSLILEKGVRVPVVFFTNPQGDKVLLAGHRRVTGCRMLADRHQPGFTRDMEITAIEMVGATPVDLLVQSLSDNNNRQDLRQIPRLRAVKMLHDAGAEVKRAARALGVSDQTYARDLRIVRHSWMYQHVEDRSIAPTLAAKLLEVAEQHKRVKELKEDLDEWIAGVKKQLKDEARRLKANSGKEMRPADMEVKNRMPSHLVNHWFDCIKNHRRFDSDADWEYRAGVENGVLRVSPINLDLSKASGEQAIKVLAALSQTVKTLAPLAQERVQIEQNHGPAATQPAPYDFDLLRKLGLTDHADRLEEKYRLKLQESKDGEEDPERNPVAERTESDLTGDIELPVAASDPASPAASDNPKPAQ